MAANYFPVLQAVRTLVANLALADWTGQPLPIVIRKLPKVDEEIDALPLLCLVPPSREPVKKVLAFGPIYRVEYPCEAVFIAANNRDFTSHLDTYMAWQAAVSSLFNAPAALKAVVPAVFDVNVSLGLVIDRAQVNDNYDYGGLTITPVTSESN